MEERFAHSAPVLYDRYMGPLLFESCAKVVGDRCATLAPKRILETAAGTGIVTRAIHRAVPSAQIVATDINPAMLDFATRKLQSANVRFQYADALNLPFAEGSFDLLVCQFGAMFFSDKIRASQEAHRVLRPHGHYLLVTFNQLEFNPIPKAAQDAVTALFTNDPLAYMECGPFSYADPEQIKHDLLAGGFNEVEVETLELMTAVNAHDAAHGLVFGSPLRSEIERRDASALDRAAEAVSQALAEWDGKNAPLSAHLVTARILSAA